MVSLLLVVGEHHIDRKLSTEGWPRFLRTWVIFRLSPPPSSSPESLSSLSGTAWFTSWSSSSSAGCPPPALSTSSSRASSMPWQTLSSLLLHEDPPSDLQPSPRKASWDILGLTRSSIHKPEVSARPPWHLLGNPPLTMKSVGFLLSSCNP